MTAAHESDPDVQYHRYLRVARRIGVLELALLGVSDDHPVTRGARVLTDSEWLEMPLFVREFAVNEERVVDIDRGYRLAFADSSSGAAAACLIELQAENARQKESEDLVNAALEIEITKYIQSVYEFAERYRPNSTSISGFGVGEHATAMFVATLALSARSTNKQHQNFAQDLVGIRNGQWARLSLLAKDYARNRPISHWSIPAEDVDFLLVQPYAEERASERLRASQERTRLQVVERRRNQISWFTAKGGRRIKILVAGLFCVSLITSLMIYFSAKEHRQNGPISSSDLACVPTRQEIAASADAVSTDLRIRRNARELVLLRAGQAGSGCAGISTRLKGNSAWIELIEDRAEEVEELVVTGAEKKIAAAVVTSKKGSPVMFVGSGRVGVVGSRLGRGKRVR